MNMIVTVDTLVSLSKEVCLLPDDKATQVFIPNIPYVSPVLGMLSLGVQVLAAAYDFYISRDSL